MSAKKRITAGEQSTKQALREVLRGIEARGNVTRERALINLLTDLRHLMDDMGEDFHWFSDRSYAHYVRERHRYLKALAERRQPRTVRKAVRE